MSKQMIKILGILLSVCFLMSTTAAAWSSETKVTGMEAKEMMKERMIGKISEEKDFGKCNNVFIRNLIIAKNIIIVRIGAHPLLRAMLLKKAMKGEGMMGEEGMMGAPCEGKLVKVAAVKKLAEERGEGIGERPLVKVAAAKRLAEEREGSVGPLAKVALAKKMANAE